MENKNSLLRCGEDKNENRRYLTFWTNGQLYGIAAEDVVQIVGMQKITAVLEYPEYVKGIIHLRKAVYPVVDVRLRMGLPQVSYHDRTCIVIVKVEGKSFGLIVDGVDEVLDIRNGQISAPPRLNGNDTDNCIMGIASIEASQHEKRDIILIISASKLLGDNLAYIAENKSK